MRAVPRRIVRPIRVATTQSVETSDATGESRVDVRRRALVEAGIGDADNLSLALVFAAGDRHLSVHDRSGDVVEQLALRHLLDVVNEVERRECLELRLGDGEADLA